MNKKIVKDAMILFAFTVVLGLLLGIVNEITKEPIAKVNYEIEQNAYREVFKDADSFEAVESFTAKDAAKIIAKSEYTADEITDVNAAKDKDGNILGYVINVTSHEGSQADISLSVGIRMDGTLNGYSITSISETPGLGMLVKEKPFYSQFENKAEESYNVVKSTPAADNEIESVTGATISSRAVTNAVNASLLYFRTALQGGN
ncbi:MAG: RnfABCDGE type electron transport complex subunit G [Lachnospiraceae bacterium]|nr:RnfABCDGE type electron transport complex subunit G [Lachnospiraceae bacterium]MDD7379303.1 RnfABCDGE type electron transport complex subunit G [Lachnospiraceae bacterium]MDY4618371.1 RnfABCDGE type electron transport complex subunit G [Lachnospiraceae bacterium]